MDTDTGAYWSAEAAVTKDHRQGGGGSTETTEIYFSLF